ncbi:GntR family transcriptional regulator [Marinactinospora rubrisoli]|uniref:GntR family transcriptional regulator n=1 Tax=Marinactinospora rubrisoli TaxID=2715399 RepID=A0ABW2KA66_9ACTN
MHPTSSATDRTYHFTKDAILSRRYAGGELISEGDIAADVGVSRTPVREALLRLQAEGLVRLYPKRGALVVPVSQQEVDDVIETRRLVEGFTAERAAAAPAERRRELVARLDALLERMAELVPTDRRGVVLADREFHRTIVSAAGNEILTALYESLRDRQLRMMEEGSRTVERMRRNIEDHGVIRAAIESGDGERARAAVHAHIDAAAELLGARR